jgi:hypothetical protein
MIDIKKIMELIKSPTLVRDLLKLIGRVPDGVTRTALILLIIFSIIMQIVATSEILRLIALLFAISMIVWIIYFEIAQSKKVAQESKMEKMKMAVEQFVQQLNSLQLKSNKERFLEIKKLIQTIVKNDQRHMKELESVLTRLLDSIEKSIIDSAANVDDVERAGIWLETHMESLITEPVECILAKYIWLKNEKESLTQGIYQHLEWIENNLKKVRESKNYTRLQIELPTTYSVIYGEVFELIKIGLIKNTPDLAPPSRDIIIEFIDELISKYSILK